MTRSVVLAVSLLVGLGALAAGEAHAGRAARTQLRSAARAPSPVRSAQRPPSPARKNAVQSERVRKLQLRHYAYLDQLPIASGTASAADRSRIIAAAKRMLGSIRSFGPVHDLGTARTLLGLKRAWRTALLHVGAEDLGADIKVDFQPTPAPR
jgi:hypothetical protein